MGLILMSLGLAAKEAGEGTLAADALGASISDGRVTSELLNGMLARLFSSHQNDASSEPPKARWSR